MAAPARELSNQADIVRLFAEGDEAVFQFLSVQGSIMEEMICDKCYDIDTGDGLVSSMTHDSYIFSTVKPKKSFFEVKQKRVKNFLSPTFWTSKFFSK